MKKIIFTGEYITLGQFLKKVDLIDSGSDAKHFLSLNRVFINNEVDERRGRKLRNKDQVKIGKEIWILINEDWTNITHTL